MDFLEESDGNHVKFKARLVVKGFSQKKGINSDETFSMVANMSSIRVVLGLATLLDSEVE